LSKLAASRGRVCALCMVPVLAIVAAALLSFTPFVHRGNANVASTGSAVAPVGTPAARGRVQASYAALPLAFEQNQGQTDDQVKYLARGNGYTLFLTANDAVFSLNSPLAQNGPSRARHGIGLSAKTSLRAARKDATAVVRMQLAGANSHATVAASGLLPGKSNYFLGNDPSKWRTGVAHYARVAYQDVYPGVNLAYHGAQSQLEFDFVVAPGANPAPIGFHFTGAQRVKTDNSGNLLISSAAGDVLLHKPVAYQEQNGARQTVDARFALKADNQVSFELGNYDRSRELVIDPAVSYEYSTYLGGSGTDVGEAIAFDASGNAYVTGQTASANFPVVGGIIPNTLHGAANAFVTKIAADGSSLGYSTYVGGSGSDTGNGIAVNQTTGAACVTGATTSTDFPHTAGAYQTTLGTGAVSNAFVLELSPSGGITYSTYLGGTGEDNGLGIALGSSGDVYVVGRTSSTDFPTAPTPPLQGHLSGSSSSGFVTKLNSTGTAPLLYSTYLGGSSAGDTAGAVAVDSSGDAYVTGQTYSSTFPVMHELYSSCGGCSGGNSDAFVTVISPTGSAYVYSTFLGGSSNDAGDGIAVDSTGIYVVGTTESSDFPTSTGSLQTSYGGDTDAFVTKFNLSGSALVYSTYLGGSGFEAGASVAVDATNNAYVTGQTTSSNFPTASPTQSTIGGGADAFVSEISSTGSQLVFSTYLGGSQDEDNGGNYGAIAVDGPGQKIYVTGNTESSGNSGGFPTSGALQANNGGGTDAFVTKYTQAPSFTVSATTPAGVAPGTSGMSTVTLTAFHGYASNVNLTCTVSGSGSPAPACSASSFSPDSVTPTTGGATSALTITTTGASSAMLVPRSAFYAMWLPVVGLSLVGMSFGSSGSRRKKLMGFLMLGTIMAALFLMPACGGGSNNGGGGGGGGTPSGAYTVTITGTGTDANAVTASTQITLNVN
jgi:Beta-propeller repeat